MKVTETAVILLVDNDPSVRGYLEHVIKGAGHVCVTAASGAQALAEWRERSFDLVVSDLNMPNGDGIALARALARSEAVPIIFITGFAGEHQDRIADIKGAVVLEKPFEAEDLLRLIAATLDGAELGEDGRHTIEDGRRRWYRGMPYIFRSGTRHEAQAEPLDDEGGIDGSARAG